MRQFITLPIIVSGTLFFLFTRSGLAQNTIVFIEGPGFLCGMECRNFSVASQELDLSGASVKWSVGANTGGGTTGLPLGEGPVITLCGYQFGTISGDYRLIANVSMPDGGEFTASLNVLVGISEPIFLFSDGSACESAGSSPGQFCERVCPGSTITYFAEFPTVFPIEWSVTGAASYTIDSIRWSVTVNWGDSGSGSVAAFGFTLDQCPSEASLCVEIIEDPVASFSTVPDTAGDTLRICQGQTVSFQNTSQGAASYLWELGPFGTSDQTDEAFTFHSPGTFQVRLIAYNDCRCAADTASLAIVVDAAESPLVDCQGTVCAGETVTYTAQTTCGAYFWTISSNGTIVEGGGPEDNYVTIDWTDGPEGVIELRVEDCPGAAVCQQPALIHIPVLTDDAPITGPERVCKGQSAIYTLPDYEGTSFTWSVSPFGTISSGQGTHAITVDWFAGFFPNQPQWVAVQFDNCYLGCGGTDTLVVNIRPEYYLSGPIEVCAGDHTGYLAINTQTNLPVSGQWTVTAPDGTLSWSSAGSTDSPLVVWDTIPGIYTLRFFAGNTEGFCTEVAETMVRVKAPPPPLTGIGGEDDICPGRLYTYAALSASAKANVRWEITDGGTISTRYGRNINVSWGPAPPYHLSVLQESIDGLGCTSQPFVMDLRPLGSLAISGAPDVCLDQTSTFSTADYEGLDYQWQVLPAGAGTITGDADGASITILWHRTGAARVELEVCNATVGFDVVVHAPPKPVAVYPPILCPGDTARVQTAAPFTTYVWKEENGMVLSDLPDPYLGPGYYQLIATDGIGCASDTTFRIDAYAAPVASISTPDFPIFCGSPPAATLYALSSGAGYSYQWLQDGTPVGSNTPVFSATALADFQVVVTDANGCMALSNVIELDTCSTGGGSTGGNPFDCSVSDLDFNIFPGVDCNERSYSSLAAGFIPGTLGWYFDDPGSGPANFVDNDPNPTHFFSKAGFFRVGLTAAYGEPGGLSGNCSFSRVDTVLVAAGFEVQNACPGAPVEFFDRSTFLPVASIQSWSWDFGDPASGSGNSATGPNPTHVYADSGSYLVTLTVTGANGCTSSVSRSLRVYPPPPVFFDEPLVNCEGTALNFLAQVPASVTDVTWDFGDPASGDANTSSLSSSYHIFEMPGNYSVGLTARSIYGCVNHFERMIGVAPNGLTGDINLSVPSPLCEGDSTVLMAPPGGVAWSWPDGSSAASLTVMEAGLYTLTITDAQGCTYVPDAVPVDLIRAPDAPIRAVERNAFGQPTSYSYDGLQICFGEEVVLETIQNAQYTYQWSTGESATMIEFSEERGNLLPEGQHEIFLTVTDIQSGCGHLTGPFVITVHPEPSVVQIGAAQAGLICEGTIADFSVINPEAGLTYVWNNGTFGPLMSTAQAGEYYATAVNGFGCSARSNILSVTAGPDIGMVPGGCHTRCSPDTICLPSIPGVVSYQWYYEGNPIAGPGGTNPNLVASQSGAYSVEMTASNGCTLHAAPLNLELFDGFGDFSGMVYFDLNDNGMIDPGDTLMNGVDLQLVPASGAFQERTTDTAGTYTFANISAGNYAVILDTLSLPPFVRPYVASVDTSLTGCGVRIAVDFLCFFECPSDVVQREWTICQGQSVTYNNQEFRSDTSFLQLFSSSLGCDSLEEITIRVTPPDTTDLQLETCAGTTVNYSGTTLSPGTVTPFHLVTAEGCDSIVRVAVMEVETIRSSLALQTCSGTTIRYEGTELQPGDQREFRFASQAGCDSIVTVTVTALSPSFQDLKLGVCPGGTVEYAGEVLVAGDLRSFTFTGQNGCDSTVTVLVEALPDITFDLATSPSCPGKSDGTVEVQLTATGGGPYRFSLDDGAEQQVPLFSGLAAGSYTLSVADTFGCRSEAAVVIGSLPPLVVKAAPQVIDCGQTAVTLTVDIVSGNDGRVIYQWQDGSTSPALSVASAGYYQVEISNGCETTTLEVTVGREFPDDRRLMYIPNAFSPNGDAQNDLFLVFPGREVTISTFRLLVLDRWGNLLFRTDDPDTGWDGTLNGRPVSTGVYVWSLEAEVTACGLTRKVRREGDLTLVR